MTMPETGFIKNVNTIANKIAVIEEANSIFDEGVVGVLEEIALLNLDEAIEDLKKGNYLGNRKLDINLALNMIGITEDLLLNNPDAAEAIWVDTSKAVQYSGATITFNDGVIISLPFLFDGSPTTISTHGDLITQLSRFDYTNAIQQIATVGSVVAVDSTAYSVTINSTVLTYTSDVSATVAEIITGLVNVINLDPVLVTAVGTGTSFTLSADMPGVAFTATVNGNMTVTPTVANGESVIAETAFLAKMDDTILASFATSVVGEIIRAYDVVGQNSNLERIQLHAVSGQFTDPNPIYYWAKTTSAFQTLSMRAGDIIKLGNDIDSIITLASRIREMLDLQNKMPQLVTNGDSLYTNIAKLVTIYEEITGIVTVYNDVKVGGTNYINTTAIDLNLVDSKIATVAADLQLGNLSKIKIVKDAIASVITVAASIASVNTVAPSIASVVTVAPSIASVVTTATDIAKVNTVAASIANVNTVSSSIANVNIVAPSIANVNTVSANIASVNTNATNIVAIQNASANAATATTQAGIATTQAGTATTQAGVSTTQAVISTAQAGTATTQAGIATAQATIATTQAGIATTQAGIATTKANSILGLTTQAATGAAGSLATVSYNSTDGKMTFSIPQGIQGIRGEAFTVNSVGLAVDKTLYDAQLKGFSFLAIDSALIYFKLSNTTADWSIGAPFGKGDTGDTGITGNGIGSIAFLSTTDGGGLAGAAGATDTYRITMTDATTSNFLVYNGLNGVLINDATLSLLATWSSQKISDGLAVKAPINSPTFTGTVGGVTAAMVGAPAGSGTATGTNTGDNAVNSLYSGLVNYTHPVNHAPSIITQDASNRFVTDAEKAVWNAKQEALNSGSNIKTVNGLSLVGSGDVLIAGGVTSVNGMTGDVVLPPVQTLAYTSRATLRSQTPAAGEQAIVDGLGLFVFTLASTEPDDDESCFATATGCWLLQAAHWDLVDSWQAPDDAVRDEDDEDEPIRIAANVAASFAAKVITGTATCAITSVATISSASFTGTVTGAAPGDRVIATPPGQLGDTTVSTGQLGYHTWVSAANTVTVILTNASASAANTNPAIRTAWPVTVIKS